MPADPHTLLGVQRNNTYRPQRKKTQAVDVIHTSHINQHEHDLFRTSVSQISIPDDLLDSSGSAWRHHHLQQTRRLKGRGSRRPIVNSAVSVYGAKYPFPMIMLCKIKYQQKEMQRVMWYWWMDQWSRLLLQHKEHHKACHLDLKRSQTTRPML